MVTCLMSSSSVFVLVGLSGVLETNQELIELVLRVRPGLTVLLVKGTEGDSMRNPGRIISIGGMKTPA